MFYRKKITEKITVKIAPRGYGKMFHHKRQQLTDIMREYFGGHEVYYELDGDDELMRFATFLLERVDIKMK